MRPGAYAWRSAAQDDWLVLRVEPVPPSAVSPAAGMAPGAAIVDVTARWNSDWTLVHEFSTPIEIVISNTTGSTAVPATFEGGAWRLLQRVDGSLADGARDGYWTDASGVHVLTRHLSLFTLFRDLEPPSPPKDFAGVVADDGLTLRWAPGEDNSGQIVNFVLAVDGETYGHFGATEYETKLGPFDPSDTREFTLKEVDPAGNESAPTDPLLALPPIAGLGLADATGALQARGFALGAVRYDEASTAPAGTVTDPSDVELRFKGSAVDLTVSGKPAPVVQSKLAFRVAGQTTLKGAARGFVAARLKLSKPARVVATLYSPRHVRLYTWRLDVRAGARVVKLRWPKQVRRTGTYSVVWVARSQAQTQRRTQKVRLVGDVRSKVVTLAGSRSRSCSPARPAPATRWRSRSRRRAPGSSRPRSTAPSR